MRREQLTIAPKFLQWNVAVTQPKQILTNRNRMCQEFSREKKQIETGHHPDG
jgi:hypothetical protein